MRRSRPPTASSPRNTIPTATTAAPTRKPSSRRSAKPMTSSRTRRSARPTTASARPPSRTAAAAIRSAEAGFDGFSDIFSTIFGEFMDPRGARQNAARGADLRYDLELTLEEAFTGVEKTITDRGACARAKPATAAAARAPPIAPAPARPAAAWARSARSRAFSLSSAAARPAAAAGEVIADPCRDCDGEGRALKRRKLSVKIPAGVDEGTRIRVAGEGEAGVRGARAATFTLRPHEAAPDLRARRHDPDRRMPGELHDRGTGRVDQPARASTATRSRSRFRPASSRASSFASAAPGMSVLNGRGRGDLVARILVETPTQAEREAEEAARGIPRDRDGRRMPGREELLQPGEDMLGG